MFLRILLFLTIISTLAAVRSEVQSPLSFNANGHGWLSISQDFLSSSSTTNISALLSLHKSLVEIESISNNEEAVGDFLAAYLETQGFVVEKQPVVSEHEKLQVERLTESTGSSSTSETKARTKRGRHNIFAYPKGSERKTSVLLTSHIDTVPPYIKYSLRHPSGSDEKGPQGDDAAATGIGCQEITADTEIWGRGTNDAKSCVAAQTRALIELLASFDSLPDISSPSFSSSSRSSPISAALLFVVGEETSGYGMKTASSKLGLTWDAVIFGEPTELRLVSGHKGLAGFRVRAAGKAAHSGYPWLGRSAVELLAPGLCVLASPGASAAIGLPRSDKFGDSTINVGRVEGGVAMNVVPAEAWMDVSIRLAGGTPEEAREKARKAVLEASFRANAATSSSSSSSPLAASHCGSGYEDGGSEKLSFEKMSNGYGPVDCDTDVEGFETTTVNYGTDVPNLEGKHKRYLYGPGSIHVAHTELEYVRAGDLVESVDGYKRIVLSALGLEDKYGSEKNEEL